jgi:hypothetical protein
VPISEPGESDIVWREQKWLRGLRWSNIDKNLILRHAVGSSGRPIEVDLRTTLMVLEELKDHSDMLRSIRRICAPLLLCEINAMPWSTAEFRRKWRLVAKKAGVPDIVKNRDSVPAGRSSGDRIAPAYTRRSRWLRLITVCERGGAKCQFGHQRGRTFGLNPSSAHLRATSSMLCARHRNFAASSIERPDSIAALRSSMSISVQGAPSYNALNERGVATARGGSGTQATCATSWPEAERRGRCVARGRALKPRGVAGVGKGPFLAIA